MFTQLFPLTTTFLPCWSSSKKSFWFFTFSILNLAEAPLSIRSNKSSTGFAHICIDSRIPIIVSSFLIFTYIRFICFAFSIRSAIRGSRSFSTLLSSTASFRYCFRIPTSRLGLRWNSSIISLPSMTGCSNLT